MKRCMAFADPADEIAYADLKYEDVVSSQDAHCDRKFGWAPPGTPRGFPELARIWLNKFDVVCRAIAKYGVEEAVYVDIGMEASTMELVLQDLRHYHRQRGNETVLMHGYDDFLYWQSHPQRWHGLLECKPPMVIARFAAMHAGHCSSFVPLFDKYVHQFAARAAYAATNDRSTSCRCFDEEDVLTEMNLHERNIERVCSDRSRCPQPPLTAPGQA